METNIDIKAKWRNGIMAQRRYCVTAFLMRQTLTKLLRSAVKAGKLNT
jgi:hypothetical protein